MNTEKAVAEALRELGVGEQFTFDDVLESVQARRQRPLRIVELKELGESDGVCAVWLVTEEEDLVLHARSDSELHRQQFVLHEMAHMILGHDHLEEATAAPALLPDIPKHTAMKMLLRHEIDNDVELAAEYLADRLAAGIRRSGFFQTSKFLEVFG